MNGKKLGYDNNENLVCQEVLKEQESFIRLVVRERLGEGKNIFPKMRNFKVRSHSLMHHVQKGEAIYKNTYFLLTQELQYSNEKLWVKLNIIKYLGEKRAVPLNQIADLRFFGNNLYGKNKYVVVLGDAFGVATTEIWHCLEKFCI